MTDMRSTCQRVEAMRFQLFDALEGNVERERDCLTDSCEIQSLKEREE